MTRRLHELTHLAASFALLCSLAWLGAACQDDPGRRQHERPAQGGGGGGGAAATVEAAEMSRAGLTGGKRVLRETFEQSGKLPASFKPHPKARVIDGWLRLENIRNVPPVWMAEALPERVRVEFDARALTSEGDVKVEIFGNGNDHESGYILVAGAHKNAEDWFARLGEHNDDAIKRPTRGVEKDRVYRWSIVRMGDGEVRWFIDGEPYLGYDDAQPLEGDQHAYFAFNNWTAPVEFDNIEVYDLSQSQ